MVTAIRPLSMVEQNKYTRVRSEKKTFISDNSVSSFLLITTKMVTLHRGEHKYEAKLQFHFHNKHSITIKV